MNSLNETANKILDIAEHYTKTRGFNAFSYRDIQNDLGIKTSSIHYYFPTKQDLAFCMIERYLDCYQLALKDISKSNISALQKLQKLADIFILSSKEDKFCLCGMMAMDVVTMPIAVHKQLRMFFQISEEWIARIIRDGVAAKNISDTVNPDYEASHYLATLEGGLLIARIRKNPKYLSMIVKGLLDRLSV